ncbi:hypothetical protein [Hyphomicrobium nitrativorans]|nr:hypothetical protein [Hyphomicrobium nitrativorans]
MSDTIAWLDPWYPIVDEVVRHGVERQLMLEIPQSHILARESVRLIARRGDTDDALFALTEGRVAEVHMTWRRSPETEPHWPATAIFSSLAEWAAESMIPLHHELSNLR